MRTEESKIDWTARNQSEKIRQKRLIESGGNCTHQVWVTKSIGLLTDIPGMNDPINPVVEMANNNDGSYVQVFKSKEEINAFIKELELAAKEAWG